MAPGCAGLASRLLWGGDQSSDWLVVLPILFLDFLVVALPRSVTPRMLDAQYGVEAVRLFIRSFSLRGIDWPSSKRRPAVLPLRPG
jgi:hypothetical protein